MWEAAPQPQPLRAALQERDAALAAFGDVLMAVTDGSSAPRPDALPASSSDSAAAALALTASSSDSAAAAALALPASRVDPAAAALDPAAAGADSAAAALDPAAAGANAIASAEAAEVPVPEKLEGSYAGSSDASALLHEANPQAGGAAIFAASDPPAGGLGGFVRPCDRLAGGGGLLTAADDSSSEGVVPPWGSLAAAGEFTPLQRELAVSTLSSLSTKAEEALQAAEHAARVRTLSGASPGSPK